MLYMPIVNVKRPYCGPVAIAALTGVPLSRIEKMIRRGRRGGYRASNGRRMPIKGTYHHEVHKVLKNLGCKVTAVKTYASTFGAFCEDTRHINAAFLVNVTGHYMVTAQGTYCDTSSLDGPRPIEGYHQTQRQVLRAWRVEAPTTPKYTLADEVEKLRPPKAPRNLKAERAKKLAQQIKVWESKERRAKNALKRLRPKLARYLKNGVNLGD